MSETPNLPKPEQPYGPGAICDTCGHFAARHDETGCHGVDGTCKFGANGACAGMLWLGFVWYRPWLDAPHGLFRTDEEMKEVLGHD